MLTQHKCHISVNTVNSPEQQYNMYIDFVRVSNPRDLNTLYWILFLIFILFYEFIYLKSPTAP